MVDPAALVLSLSGVAIMAVAYLNREKSAWQRDMRVIIIIAIGKSCSDRPSWQSNS
jgi:hypothetical protein